MYGMIVKLNAAPGQRDAFIAILKDSVSAMPGCISYVVALDPADENAIWVTEVWESQESHDASLSFPAVTKAMAQARAMITGMASRVVTTPVGGYGLADPYPLK